MTVRVRLSTALAEWGAGAAELELTGRTVGQVLHALTDQQPGLATLVWSRHAEPNPMLVTFVNGEDVRHLQGLETAVKDGDEVLLISAVEGGESANRN